METAAQLLETGGVLARGISAGKRRQCRLLQGAGRGFATDTESVYVPWPLPESLHGKAFSCAVALQCAPSKELLAELPLARLASREQLALLRLEASYALAWVNQHCPGLVSPLNTLSGDIEPNAHELPTASDLLTQSLILSKERQKASIPALFGQLPVVKSAVPSLSTIGSQLESRLPWNSSKRLERLSSWSVAIAGEGDQSAAQAGTPNPDEQERTLTQRGARVGIPYPEWNELQQTYRKEFVSVIESKMQRSTVSEVGQKEAVDPHVAAWFRQPVDRRWCGGLEDGVDIDVDKLVADRMDDLTGGKISQRIYRDRIMSDRDVATLLLLDRSGSLSQVENLKQELQCANALSRAMQESGERYAVYSFWSDTRHHVAVDVWRDFDDRHSPDLSLKRFKPRGYTRLGAAIRHSVYKLRQQAASRHLLLVLGDALPSDEGYEGQYAVADVCKAVEDAEDNQVVVAFIAVGNTSVDPVGDAMGSQLTRVRDTAQLAPVLADVHARLCA